MDIRNILMVISLGLSVLIGLAVGRNSGGGAASSGSGPLLIGLSLDTLKEARWQRDRDMFAARCKELGADVLVNSANGDDSQQAKDVQSLLAAGCKTIVIAPHDAVAMSASVDACKKAGVPVLSYDRLIQNANLDLYVSFDNVNVGRQQGKYLVDHLPTPGKGKIVRIYGAPTDNNAKLFKQGQDEALKPYLDRGDVQVVHEDWAEDWKPENAKRICNAAIASGKTFDGVLASNDGTAGGAIQALSESNLAKKVLVTGQDAELAACQRIAAGTQAMTIYKPLKQVASLAGDLAVNLAKGKPIVATATAAVGNAQVPAVLHETQVITKDNLMDVVKDGFHTYEDIYGSLPDNQRPPKPQ